MKKKDKLRKKIHSEQENYKRIRRRAHSELEFLKEYFGALYSNEELVYQSILSHLNATQKELSYFGLRGIIVGIVAAIFTFGFNTTVFPELIKVVEVNKLAGFILSAIFLLVFFILFLLSVWQPFSLDRKRRRQLYINEYIIEIIKGEIKELESNSKRES